LPDQVSFAFQGASPWRAKYIPGLAITLAPGIGANTASFFGGLRRTPAAAALPPARKAGHDRGGAQAANTSYPDFLNWTTSARSFDALAAYAGDAFVMSNGGEPKITFAGQAPLNFLCDARCKVGARARFQK
jgi:hypothetical protein